MDFSLSDHQKLIRDTVRQFMENEVRPGVRQREREARFPTEEIKKIAALGCCGMTTPEEWGGGGLDTISFVLMMEEVARVDAAMATSLSVTNSAVQPPLLQFGSDARCFIVFAKTDPEAGGKGITAFLVEPGFKGFRVGRHEEKMGQLSSPSVEIILNDCEVPAENRLGEEGQGLKIALSALDGGRIGIGALAVGLAQGALEESVKYAKQRRAFGKNIAEFQAIQFMLADMETEIEAARSLVHHAAWLKDAHPAKM